MSLGGFERDDVGDFPTPVEEVPGLGIWAKREDRSHTLYGGNKVRKLAYLLPEARRRGGDLLTLGATGSHHLLACSLHGKRFGVRTHALVLPQPSTPHVEKNWSKLQLEAASITMVSKEFLLPLAAIDAAEKVHRSHGHRPYFVWAGGSTPLGSLGWGEGGLELGINLFDIYDHQFHQFAPMKELLGPVREDVVVSLVSIVAAVALLFLPETHQRELEAISEEE